MPRISQDKLQQIVRESFEALGTNRKRFKGMFQGEARLYRKLTGLNVVGSQLLDQLTLEKVREHLEWRLKKISYPYPPPPERVEKNGFKSFYQHFQQRGILDLVLNPPLLEDIAQTWLDLRSYDLYKQLHVNGRSQYRHPLTFHREAMEEIAGHLQQLSDISSKHHVALNWFGGYVSQVRKALLREAEIYYPDIPASFKKASEFAPQAQKIAAQLILFGSVVDIFRFNQIVDSMKLAYHLTALICSHTAAIDEGKLEPTPKTISKNVRANRD